jgi:uncharacterized membrane protein (TIGR01666 family)
MRKQTREIQGFFYSQYFSDGLRISLGVLLPSIVFVNFGMLETGLTLSLGALCVSGSDNPGPVYHKRNGMIICNLLMFAVAIITGFARMNMYTMGLEIVVLAFVFSMFTIYGNRAASIGTACLLIMVLMMDKALEPSQVLGFSAIILAGGVWYMAMSIAFFTIRPYRAAQQALGENILDVSKFLRLKANFYLPGIDIDDNYHKIISQQIHVSHNQDAVRELLFKSRLTVKESTNASRMLVLTFVDAVDMFESMMATHYDYSELHQKFETTGILEEMGAVITHIADELENIGFAIQSNSRYHHLTDLNPELERLKTRIDGIGESNREMSTLALKKILINLRNLNQQMINIYNYNNSDSVVLLENKSDVEYSKFVSHQEYDPQIYVDNLTLSSSIFRHSLRVAVVCLVGFITAKTISHGHHSYWILLTIIVILKPGFSLTKQRNYQRLLGTIAGGLLGVVIVTYISDNTVLFILLTVFMIGAYSFQRVNYIVSVILMTPYVLILFKFLGVGHVVQERIADTAIGSVLAFISSYLILPTWEYYQIRENLNDVLKANINYLVKVAETLSGRYVNITEYKLVRKDIYVKSANLSAAFERMTSEPKKRQRHIKDIHKFVVLNHILTSYIGTIARTLQSKGIDTVHPENIKLIRRAINILNETSKKLRESSEELPKLGGTTVPMHAETTLDSHLLKEQLEFVTKVSIDISKVTDAMLD